MEGLPSYRFPSWGLQSIPNLGSGSLLCLFFDDVLRCFGSVPGGAKNLMFSFLGRFLEILKFEKPILGGSGGVRRSLFDGFLGSRRGSSFWTHFSTCFSKKNCLRTVFFFALPSGVVEKYSQLEICTVMNILTLQIYKIFPF